MSDPARQRQMDSAELQRCNWCAGSEIYQRYHDEEWGVPEYAADALFERLVLEGMQAGLSWLTVLNKRAGMRKQFFDFDVVQLAQSTPADIECWMADPGVIRHRGKLEAMTNNARITLRMHDFAAWMWEFAPAQQNVYQTPEQVPSTSEESRAMSKALKKAGFRFVGPTICYAFMQSVGMVNDHLRGCWRHQLCADQQRQPRPWPS